MEIEKVIRTVALTLVVAAFALQVTTRLLFPDAVPSCDGPLAIVLLLCVCAIWRRQARTDSRRSDR